MFDVQSLLHRLDRCDLSLNCKYFLRILIPLWHWVFVASLWPLWDIIELSLSLWLFPKDSHTTLTLSLCCIAFAVLSYHWAIIKFQVCLKDSHAILKLSLCCIALVVVRCNWAFIASSTTTHTHTPGLWALLLLGSPVVSWALLSPALLWSPELCWALLGPPGFSWALLGPPGLWKTTPRISSRWLIT